MFSCQKYDIAVSTLKYSGSTKLGQDKLREMFKIKNLHFFFSSKHARKARTV